MEPSNHCLSQGGFHQSPQKRSLLPSPVSRPLFGPEPDALCHSLGRDVWTVPDCNLHHLSVGHLYPAIVPWHLCRPKHSQLISQSFARITAPNVGFSSPSLQGPKMNTAIEPSTLSSSLLHRICWVGNLGTGWVSGSFFLPRDTCGGGWAELGRAARCERRGWSDQYESDRSLPPNKGEALLLPLTLAPWLAGGC